MEKWSLRVCPHDTAKRPERWFALAQYLGQQLDAAIRFDQAMDFAEFHQGMHEADLIYANPQDALRLLEGHGFIPLCRATNLFDETVFIASPSARHEGGLKALEGQPVASVTSMLPTNIARHVLEREGIRPGEIVDKPSWLAVLNSVYREEVPYGFLYRDFFNDLNGLNRKSIEVLHESGEQTAFHMFMLHPQQAIHADALAGILSGMADSERGRAVLEDLGMDAFRLVEEEHWDIIQTIRERYA